MDALKGWFSPSRKPQTGYLPLSQNREDDEHSNSGLFRSTDDQRFTSDDPKPHQRDRNSEDDLLPLEFFGIELHPDTYGLLEDDQSLSEAFGGNGLKDVFSSRIVVICAISACLGGLLFGFDQGLLSIVLVMPQFLRVSPEVDPVTSPRAEFNKGLMTATLELGAFLGAILSGYISDKHSRRLSIAFGLCWFITGSTLQTLSQGYPSLVWGRGLGGVGIGVLSSTAPIYVAEISPPNIRGTLLVVEQFMIVFGIVVMYYITYYTRHITGEWSYRLPFLIQILPALLLASLLYFLPYSPRWLASQKGRDLDCLQVLVRLRKLPPSDPRVQAEWISIRTEAIHSRRAFAQRHPELSKLKPKLEGGKEGTELGWGLFADLKREWAGWVEMFGPEVIKRTHVGMGIMFFQQFVGINALIYYSPTLFETLGLDYERRLSLSGIMNVVQLVAVMIALVYIERFGRKTWLFIGSIGMTLSHVVVAGMIGRYSDHWSSHPIQAWIGVGAIFTFVFTFGLSFGPMGWLIPAEVHGSSFRSKGVALATCTNWMSNFIVGLITPPLVQKTGYGAFLFFAAFGFSSGLWVWIFVPETKGKSLEQMDEVFKSPTGRLDELAKREIREWLIRSDRRTLNTDSDFEMGNEDGMEDELERIDG
ncbi:hypothetical protein FFLO_01038 [Filobasidium floriforme]|uniref:Major facilitator superfamily (MFS) profile domain-containing protein n=1 Tax=Filobasidium floriforme TaxID=5210 RepID=A0A8K0NV94_9TREE|nr:hypothetical protein FFLO_01038 [Filobasidium floriforme]